MRPRVTLVLGIVTVLIGGVMLVPATYARLTGDDSPASLAGAGGGAEQPSPPPPSPPPPTLAAGPVLVDFQGDFLGWALMDRSTGKIDGSKNMSETNSTESMLKAWIVSDYLRQLGGKDPSAALQKAASLAIRDSNDDAADQVYSAAGGSYRTQPDGKPDPVIQRAIKTCGLTDTRRSSVGGKTGWWSFTEMSPRDAVRLGNCIASGKAAGPKWTKWVLNEMSKVRGSVKDQQAKSGGGRWGIIDGLPAEIKAQGPVSIKNGWTQLGYDGNWHVNCLAVTNKWSLAVMMRYPAGNGLTYGAQVCASIASQLVTPQPGAALKVPPQPVGKP